jgi:type I restriction enzyme S subunit
MSKTVTLGSVCSLVNGKSFKPSDWSTVGVPIVRIQNLNGSDSPFNHFAGSLANQVPIKSGDLLLAWSGTPGTSFGAHIWQGGDAILNQHIFRCDIDTTAVTAAWAKFVINMQLNQLIGLAHGGVGLKHVTRGIVESLKIPLPSLAEQRRIAEILDRAETLRAKRNAALAQLDTLTQSVFLDLLREAGQSVATVSIEDGMEAIIDYRGKSPTKTAVGVPLVTARVVKGGALLEPNEFIAEEDYDAWMRRGIPNRGDVLFTTEAPLGEVAQLDGRKVALAQRLLVLRGKPSLVDNTFLKHALTAQEVKKQIDARATGSTVRGIRQRELRKVMIPVPPFALQRDFARRVAAVEKLKAAHRTSLAELNALFAMLQHRAFRGEL